jgi:hypothetical protein
MSDNIGNVSSRSSEANLRRSNISNKPSFSDTSTGLWFYILEALHLKGEGPDSSRRDDDGIHKGFNDACRAVKDLSGETAPDKARCDSSIRRSYRKQRAAHEDRDAIQSRFRQALIKVKELKEEELCL